SAGHGRGSGRDDDRLRRRRRRTAAPSTAGGGGWRGGRAIPGAAPRISRIRPAQPVREAAVGERVLERQRALEFESDADERASDRIPAARHVPRTAALRYGDR